MLLNGEIPEALNLPTGLGKTSVIALWLIALGRQALRSPFGITLPRRIVWVVDRRVVVDQATEEAVMLAKRLSSPPPELAALSAELKSLSVSDDGNQSPIAAITQRGETVNHREWSRRPSKPAIVVRTAAIVWSRLLFSKYGERRNRRPCARKDRSHFFAMTEERDCCVGCP